MNTYQILIFTLGAFLSIGYLNFCTSNDDFAKDAPRIWPNISENSSFLQFPGLTGAGGLDISIYDIFAGVVNVTRSVPYLAAKKGNFTLLQIAIMGAVGAIACGAASLLAEAAFFQQQEKNHGHGHFKRRQDEYDMLLPPLQSEEPFEPAVRTSDDHRSGRAPRREFDRHKTTKYFNYKNTKYLNGKRRVPAKIPSRKRPLRNWSRERLKIPYRIYNGPILPKTRNRYDRTKVIKDPRKTIPINFKS